MDNTLKLLIELGVVGKEDAKAAMDLLKEGGEQTNGAAAATRKLGEAEHEAAGHAEHLHINHRALHQIMHLIGKETAPELGHALGGMLFGPIGMAVAAGYAFEFLREKIAKTNEELDKMGEKAGEAYAKVKENLFDAIKEETFSSEKIDRFFASIKTQSEAAKKEIENAFALLREKNSTQLEQNKAQEQSELKNAKDASEEAAIRAKWAAVNAALKRQMEQDVANEAKALWEKATAEVERAAAAKTQFEQKSYSSEQRDQIDRLVAGLKDQGPEGEMKKRFAAEKEAGTFDYQKAIDFFQSETHKQNIESTKSALEADTKTADKEKAKAQPEIDRLKEKIAVNNAELEAMKNETGPGADAKRGSRIAQNQWSQERIDLLEAPIKTAEAKVKADEAYIQSQLIAAEIVKERAETEKKYTAELEAARASLAAALIAKHQSQAVADVKKTGIQKTELFSNQNEIIEKGVAAEELALKGVKLNKDQIAAINNLHALADASGTNMATIVALVKMSLEAHETQAATIDDLKRQFADLALRVAAGRNKTNNG